jgi:PAT family beta-lactamase induction signal transducer AmpG
MLGMITLFHLSDYLRGPMSNPYYHSLGIDLTTIAGVRASIGLAGTILGVAVGGMSALRLGVKPSLVIGALIQPVAIAAYALLGWHGGDFAILALGPLKLSAYQAIMAFDGFAIAYSGVALTTYMSSLTSLGYTATQYALLTSALVAAGKILKGFSGVIVEGLKHGRSLLDAYAAFYLLAAAVGVPAIVLCVVLALRTERRVGGGSR